jgi:hypothetical protein
MENYTKQLEKRIEELERINAALEFRNMLIVGAPSSAAGDIIEIRCCYRNDKKPDILSHFIDAGLWEHKTLSKIVALCIPKLLKGDKLIDTVSISKKRIYRSGVITVWQVDFSKKIKNWYLSGVWRGTHQERYAQIPVKSKSVGMKIDWFKNELLTQVTKEINEINKMKIKWTAPI